VEELERVWERVKDRAALYAERDVVITPADSRMTVIQICREERTERPPPDALDFLASELVRLTTAARRELRQRISQPP
jgi:hypothetical protein